MISWQTKAAIQNLLSVTPGGRSINRLLQLAMTKRLVLTDKRFNVKVRQCKDHLRLTKEKGGNLKNDFVAFELGTGWHPIVPIGLWLCGAEKVYSVDINSLVGDRQVRETIEYFLKYINSKKIKEILPQSLSDRISKFTQIIEDYKKKPHRELLRGFDIETYVEDAQFFNHNDKKIDFFVSNCVLEHIDRETLLNIFNNFKTISSKYCIMSHLIDLSDHYADFDGSIGAFNFLKFSTDEWKKYNNSFHYHNRLRVSDYREIYKEAGFAIAGEENVSGARDDLNVVLADDFSSYSMEDLLVKRSRLIGIYECTHPSS